MTHSIASRILLCFAFLMLLDVTSRAQHIPQPLYTWKPTGFPLGSTISTIFIQPLTGHIFVGTRGSGIMRSSNGGCDWESRNDGLASTNVNSITQTVKGYMFAGTDSGIYRSINNSDTWQGADSGLTGRHVNVITPVGPVLYAGTEHYGIFRSTDSGSSWRFIPSIGAPAVNVESFGIGLPHTLLAGTNGQGILRSTDSGVSWSIVNALDSSTTTSSFTSTLPGVILAGTSTGILRTTDNGTTWSTVNNGLGTNTNIHSLAIDQLGTLLAATDAGSDSTGLVFQSNDRGTNWIQRDSGLPAIHSLAISGGLLGQDTSLSWIFTPALVGTSGSGMYSAIAPNCAHDTAIARNDSIMMDSLIHLFPLDGDPCGKISYDYYAAPSCFCAAKEGYACCITFQVVAYDPNSTSSTPAPGWCGMHVKVSDANTGKALTLCTSCFQGPPGWSIYQNAAGDYSLSGSDINNEFVADLLDLDFWDFRFCFTDFSGGKLHFDVSFDGCSTSNLGHSDGQDRCEKLDDQTIECLPPSSVSQRPVWESIMLGYPYPNPAAGGGVSFDYMQRSAYPANISVLDANGKIISALKNWQGIGTNRIYVETSSLPSGAYICVVEAGTEKLSRRFIVEKH